MNLYFPLIFPSNIPRRLYTVTEVFKRYINLRAKSEG